MNKGSNKELGLICKFTNQKPTFSGECPYYDPVSEDKLIEALQQDHQTKGQKGKAKAIIALSFFLFVSLLHIFIKLILFKFKAIVVIPSFLGFLLFLVMAILIIINRSNTARIVLTIVIGLRILSNVYDLIRYFDVFHYKPFILYYSGYLHLV